jgi:2-oxoglutarate dehydrogenase E1 component
LSLDYCGRASSAAPASGYMSVHLEEQRRFINEALETK